MIMTWHEGSAHSLVKLSSTLRGSAYPLASRWSKKPLGSAGASVPPQSSSSTRFGVRWNFSTTSEG